MQFNFFSVTFSSGKRHNSEFNQFVNIAMRSIKVHAIRITHTLDKGGVKMVEVIEETYVFDQSTCTLIKKIVIHTRQLNDKKVVIKSVNGAKQDMTQLPPDEMKAFCTEWKQDWKPKATKIDIMNALKNKMPAWALILQVDEKITFQ